VPTNRSQHATQKAGTASSTTPKAGTVDNKGASSKLVQSTGKESPKSVCRPRRPAAGNVQAMASRAAATGGVKERNPVTACGVRYEGRC
jgi:hypothetical protein